MRANEKITCPVCGETSVAKLKLRLDGFTPAGEELVCMLCGAGLGAPEMETAAGPGAEKLHDLGVLLGAAPAAPARLAAATAEQRFCKDCVYFIEHPFVTRCALDQHAADAMADCPRYVARHA